MKSYSVAIHQMKAIEQYSIPVVHCIVYYAV